MASSFSYRSDVVVVFVASRTVAPGLGAELKLQVHSSSQRGFLLSPWSTKVVQVRRCVGGVDVVR